MNEQPTRPASAHRPTTWRSLDELADTPEFRDFLEGEFPQAAAHLPGESVNRRRFLQLMAASLALGGLSGCRRPEMQILPYSRKPEEIVPGLPTFYATTIPRPGGGFPVLVESHEGRPTKIEGNPEHPHSKGKTDALAQAAILDLYDPDRSTEVYHNNEVSTSARFTAAVGSDVAKLGKVAFLVEDIRSPALWMLARDIKGARWFVHEPLGRENVAAGIKDALGKSLVPSYDLAKADVVVALDADLFGLDDNAVSNIRGFAANRLREVKEGNKHDLAMSRLYVVEDQLSTTGSMADNRLPLRGSSIAAYAKALTAAVLSKLNKLEPIKSALGKAEPPADVPSSWVDKVADDLVKHAGKSLVVAGPRQPAIVHSLACALNEALDNVGESKPLVWRDVEAPKVAGGLAELVKEMAGLDTLIILGSNPVFTAPAEYGFAGKLAKIKTSIHLSLYKDETSVACTWHVPMSHFLESWGDLRAYDGTYCTVQPLIAPLYEETRSPLELLARWTQSFRSATPYGIVLESFKQTVKGDEKAFREVLHRGYRPGSAADTTKATVKSTELAASLKDDSTRPLTSDLELSFHGSPSVLDGRFANNAWMQETPEPVSKLVWDNAALVGPKTAGDLKLETGDIVTLETKDGKLEIPVFVQPGQASNSLSVQFGYGRAETGRVSNGSGFNVYPLRSAKSPWFTEVKLTKTGRKYTLASTQNHGNMTESSRLKSEAGRVDEIARIRDLKEFTEKKEHEHKGHLPLLLITHPELTGQYQWGMVIDLTRCVGCNACQVACQAENNIPIVGKGEILRGRELYWIRIDRYYTGNEDNPVVRHQPVACVHCVSAPCETVCPVNAAVHSPEGLNVQVYNRCIGTRYCANNCPYKVRRFNWFDYHQRPLDELRLGPLAPKGKPEPLKMQMNPDVTVRMRGVMERCSYCVQRIERGKIGAKVADPTAAKHPIPDGAIVPACAQACPAEAIVFGDLKNETHRVTKLKKDHRHYVLLESVGTKPRTTYLLRLRNPNADVKNA